MSKRFLIGVAFCVATLTLPYVVSGILAADEQKKTSTQNATDADEAFSPTRVWTIHIEIPADEYDAMQPTGGFFGGPPPQQPQTPKEPKEKRQTVRNLFGMEFPWVHGTIEADSDEFSDVAIRYSGNASYFASAQNLKRSFQIDADRYQNQQINGHSTINLQCGAMDPTKIREALANGVFRAADVPAPRTALAEVTLTVPGKFDHEHLGLYTVMEQIDQPFVDAYYNTSGGLLLTPQRMRGVEYLGDDWQKYLDQYQPQSEATPEQSQRVTQFAKLINNASDAEFQQSIAEYLDVEEFLRFMAANALLSNLDGFLSFGHNYYLYLNPQTKKFVFLPGDVDLSFGNFMMMGSGDQLMDLSIMHPYPGDQKLAERLLAINEVREKYHKVLRQLSSTAVSSQQLLPQIDELEKLAAERIEKETKAREARGEGPGGFGPPGGPQAPDLRTFVDKRLKSVAAQLDGTSTGYIPQFNFGPQRREANEPAIDDTKIRDLVQAPEGFDVTLYAAPPDVHYPVAIAASPTGEVFIAVDEQGSLGRTPGGGKIMRCIDTDDDGKADQINVFAEVDHPRGIIYQNGTAWVLHPPYLSVFHDDDLDGKADRQQELLSGLTTDLIDTRGGDHTCNGIRMGIDGWIYIADGDYGIIEAKGIDGTKFSLRGGGILRVRPDGTELEVFATGLRNPFDIGIDPYLNLFTRDNTNDGAGWDVRVSHLVQTAHYGYTQLYANYPDEIMPPLGQFGGGGGTGVLYLNDRNWPQAFRDKLYTGDWGRSEVYVHNLQDDGASFRLDQEVFLTIPRPTGMDVDGSGRLFVASWQGGEASVYIGPYVGFIARVVPRDLHPKPFPKLSQATNDDLIRLLADENAVWRLHAQREILRRGSNEATSRALIRRVTDKKAATVTRIAAIFTLKQLDGASSHATLLELVEDPAVGEFAMRALTDRKRELAGLEAAPFVHALSDPIAFKRAQAIISLNRLNAVSAAETILPLTTRPEGSAMPTTKPVHAQPDPDRAIPHLAVRALVSLKAADACLAALDGPSRPGALQALRQMHDRAAVEGLIKRLGIERSVEERAEIFAALIRLYYREAPYTGNWWGIRPDSTGPYYETEEWEMSERIAAVITNAYQDGDAEIVALLRAQLAKYQVSLKGLPTADLAAPDETEPQAPIVVAMADPNNPDQIGNLEYEAIARRTLRSTGDVEQGKRLFETQSCRACHTDADGQTPKGPHLVDIGKRYKPDELVESILKPTTKIAQGYESYTFVTVDGRVLTGFVVSQSASAIKIRESNGVQTVLKNEDIDMRQRQEQSAMPQGMANNLTPEQLADLIAYLKSL